MNQKIAVEAVVTYFTCGYGATNRRAFITRKRMHLTGTLNPRASESFLINNASK
jgi:hypothetical protein